MLEQQLKGGLKTFSSLGPVSLEHTCLDDLCLEQCLERDLMVLTGMILDSSSKVLSGFINPEVQYCDGRSSRKADDPRGGKPRSFGRRPYLGIPPTRWSRVVGCTPPERDLRPSASENEEVQNITEQRKNATPPPSGGSGPTINRREKHREKHKKLVIPYNDGLWAIWLTRRSFLNFLAKFEWLLASRAKSTKSVKNTGGRAVRTRRRVLKPSSRATKPAAGLGPRKVQKKLDGVKDPIKETVRKHQADVSSQNLVLKDSAEQATKVQKNLDIPKGPMKKVVENHVDASVDDPVKDHTEILKKKVVDGANKKPASGVAKTEKHVPLEMPKAVFDSSQEWNSLADNGVGGNGKGSSNSSELPLPATLWDVKPAQPAKTKVQPVKTKASAKEPEEITKVSVEAPKEEKIVTESAAEVPGEPAVPEMDAKIPDESAVPEVDVKAIEEEPVVAEKPVVAETVVEIPEMTIAEVAAEVPKKTIVPETVAEIQEETSMPEMEAVEEVAGREASTKGSVPEFRVVEASDEFKELLMADSSSSDLSGDDSSMMDEPADVPSLPQSNGNGGVPKKEQGLPAKAEVDIPPTPSTPPKEILTGKMSGSTVPFWMENVSRSDSNGDAVGTGSHSGGQNGVFGKDQGSPAKKDVELVGSAPSAPAANSGGGTGNGGGKSAGGGGGTGKSSRGAHVSSGKSYVSGGGSLGGFGGGGGSDGGDDWRSLPDEPADGEGPEPRGLLVLAAVAVVVGSAFTQWIRKKRRRATEEASARRVLADDLRGGGGAQASRTSGSDLHFDLMAAAGSSNKECLSSKDRTSKELMNVSKESVVVSGPSMKEAVLESDCDIIIEPQSRTTTRGLDVFQVKSHNGRQQESDRPLSGRLRTGNGTSPSSPDKAVEEERNLGNISSRSKELQDELSTLWEKFNFTDENLRNSERRRKDALKDLAKATASRDTEVADLRAKLLGQEEQRSQVEKKYSELDQERNALLTTIRDAQNTLLMTQPRLTQALEKIEDLGKVIVVQKKELVQSRQDLGDAVHEKSVIQRKVVNMETEVKEVESIVNVIEQIENDLGGEVWSQNHGDKMAKVENGLKILRQLDVRSQHSRHIIASLQGLLVKVKDSLIKTETSEVESAKVVDLLKAAGKDQENLKQDLCGMRSKLRDLSGEREILQRSIDLLKSSCEEKTEALEEVKLKHEAAEEAAEWAKSRQEQLTKELNERKQALREVRSSLEEAKLTGSRARAQVQQLREEKTDLQREMTGLTRRIDHFEEETKQLQDSADTLRKDLDMERGTREGLEKKTKTMTETQAQMEGEYNKKADELKNELEEAKKRVSELQESCTHLEGDKEKLEKEFKEEAEKLREEIARMQEEKLQEERLQEERLREERLEEEQLPEELPKEAGGRVAVNGGRKLEKIMQSALRRTLKNSVSVSYPDPSGSVPMTENDSKIRAWLEDADDTSLSLSPSPAPAPLSSPRKFSSPRRLENENGGDTARESLPRPDTKKPKHQPRQRRGSWPLDMSTTISDHLFGAAQELVELTEASLQLSNAKDTMVVELDDAKRAVAETTTKLEEKDAAMSDLAEHFLQVYQIASDLATETDNTVLELRQLQLLSDNLKQQVSERDMIIMDLENRFLGGQPPASEVDIHDGFSDVSTEFPNALATPRSVAMPTPRSLITPRSTTSAGVVPRPRSQSRSSMVTPTPRLNDLVTSHSSSIRLETPSPRMRSVSNIPRAPASDTSTSRPTPRRGNDFSDGQPYLPGVPNTEHASRGSASKKQNDYHPKSRTSMKRMSAAAPRK
ncbi:hypothetical protein BSKO_07864 [Bryopsis sp. KO-2023]|nr:hypothetical protein BSKO_07864 [Bryopsis sp. KO-2023]